MSVLSRIRGLWWLFRIKRHIANSKKAPGRAHRAWLQKRTIL
ncbi:hypothetical protein [Brucella gallinifaecis]|nr:hypothetical protein [Brucella gallinifaecis]